MQLVDTKFLRLQVYAASSTYYGNAPVPYHEDLKFHQSSPYAASKYMGELLMTNYNELHGVNAMNMRFFMVYGPRNPSQGAYAIVTGVFTGRKKKGEKLMIEGTGEQYRDFVHVRDVARALILAAQSPSHVNATVVDAVNVGSGKKYSIREVADLVSPGEDRIWNPPRRHDLHGTLADTCRAKQVLRFEAWHDFTAEMKKLIDAAMAGNQFIQAGAERAYEEHFGAEIWKGLNLGEKNEMVRERIKDDPHFLETLFAK